MQKTLCLNFEIKSSDSVWFIIRLDDSSCKIQQKRSNCCENEWAEWRCLFTDSEEFNKTHLLHAFPSFSQATSQVVPTCQHAPMMAEQSACECHYGNDMKLERKQSGSAQTNKQKKKDKRREAKCTKTQRDIHQHKHRSKWLILCTTEFKRNE